MSFEDFVRGKRVVVVGPAPSIVGSKQKAKIDGYDIVVRINKAVPVPEAMKADVGTRTTILYNCLNTDPENGGKLDPKVLKQAGVSHVRCPYPEKPPFARDIEKARKMKWGPIKLSWTSIGTYDNWEKGMESRPNSGICAILDLLSYPIEELYITGFTFFKGGYYSAYRNMNEAQVHARMDKAGNHNQEKQLKFMQTKLLADKRVVMDRALTEIITGSVPLTTKSSKVSATPASALDALRSTVPNHKLPFGKHVVNIVSMNARRMQRCEKSAKIGHVSVKQRPGIKPKRLGQTELRVDFNGTSHTFRHPASCTSNMMQFGCMLAHLFAMKSAFAENPKLPVAIIGEDDIMFDLSATVTETLDTLLNRAPKNWEFLNLMPSLTKDLQNMSNGLRAPFSDRHSHGTVLYAVKRHAAMRIWHMISTDRPATYDLSILLKMTCRGSWCTVQWPDVRCDQLIAADITLYHCAKTYINTAQPLAYWDDREEFSRSCIATTRDNERCNASIEAAVKQILLRLEKMLYGQSTNLYTSSIKIANVPGTYRVCNRIMNALRTHKVSFDETIPPVVKMQTAMSQTTIFSAKKGRGLRRSNALLIPVSVVSREPRKQPMNALKAKPVRVRSAKPVARRTFGRR